MPSPSASWGPFGECLDRMLIFGRRHWNESWPSTWSTTTSTGPIEAWINWLAHAGTATVIDRSEPTQLHGATLSPV